MEDISNTLLNQRIRNRIIEVLEVTSSPSDQEKLGANEVINMWEDWVDDEKIKNYVEPVFTKQEQEELLKFHTTWHHVTNNTPKNMDAISDFLHNKYWLQLMSSATKTLDTFNHRGKLSEDAEIT